MTKRNAITRPSQSDTAIRIERLINAIQRTDSQAYRITYSKHGDELVSETRLSKYFDGIEQMVTLFEGDVEYQSSWRASFSKPAIPLGLSSAPLELPA